MAVKVGNVLIADRAFAPFIVRNILSHGDGAYEITCREEITPDGLLETSNRSIRSSSLSKYRFISEAFMDERYVKWSTEERGGLFVRKQPEPPKRPSNTQIDVVKAVFYRQHSMLYPRLTIEEIENLWSNYFLVYSQVCFELNRVIDKTGRLGPLNFDEPDPFVLAPADFLSTVTKARPYTLPPKPVVAVVPSPTKPAVAVVTVPPKPEPPKAPPSLQLVTDKGTDKGSS